jgi:hypothetical protein
MNKVNPFVALCGCKHIEMDLKEGRLRKWLLRFGLAGFLFFLIKGLIWLGIFLGIGSFLYSC